MCEGKITVRRILSWVVCILDNERWNKTNKFVVDDEVEVTLEIQSKCSQKKTKKNEVPTEPRRRDAREGTLETSAKPDPS